MVLIHVAAKNLYPKELDYVRISEIMVASLEKFCKMHYVFQKYTNVVEFCFWASTSENSRYVN